MTGRIAHLGHVELYTDRCEASLEFSTCVYGLKLSRGDNDCAWQRAWDDYEFCTQKLTRHPTPGMGHVDYRAASAQALADQVAVIAASGYKTHGWVDDDPSHGPAFRFEGPFGHIFEIYWETVKDIPGDTNRPALKNMASRYTGQGAAPRRIDNLNLLATEVAAFRRFMETCFRARVTEMILLDNGRPGGPVHGQQQDL